MYGWKFLDDPALTQDWPEQPSLTVEVRPGAASHSLYWFNECGRTEGVETVAYLIEGAVTFQELDVLRGDGTPQQLDQFIADGKRAWEAFFDRDERAGGEAQQAAQDGTPSWRPYVHASVSGGSSR